MEGWEGEFEVDGVVGDGGLDSVVFEDGVDGKGAEDFQWDGEREGSRSLRPYLGPCFGNYGEADVVIVEADPGDFSER